ncbi:hypothetical protein EPI10_027181 [Gossypium australe]|uniref:Gag-pro-like protein n=1 Tax=Gossypium australe TaxID=47621 RepID=A0A5B6UZI4_9ROSI|nr:hypothetical protein EPI10_027181 [Gossypium australe]
MQPPFPKWYDANAQCGYHARITGHSIENCIVFKKLIKRFIKMEIVKFDNLSGPNVAANPLPSHSDKGVNTIIENGGKRTKMDVAEDSEERAERMKNYCEFHAKEDHEVQECVEFRALVQNLIDNKELEFFEYAMGYKKEEVCASKEEVIKKVYKVNHPMVIISRTRSNEARVQIAPRVIIQKPVAFPYKDSKKVGFYTRSGRRYDPSNAGAEPVKGKTPIVEQKKEKTVRLKLLVNDPVIENEAREFLKFLKQSEYIIVEQLRKQLACILVLALLLSSETHRDALMKVLNKTYVANDIFGNKLDRLVNNISVDNFIFFNDDEIPLGGMGSTKALHITTRCKGYTLPGVLIHNGSALNVLPLSTLNRLPVDSSHMKTCQNIVRAFDGTERRVVGKIEMPLLIGPNMYEVDFLVMDIKPSYNCLLGRPWIHTAGAVPSSLHQKLKLVTEGRLVIVSVRVLKF